MENHAAKGDAHVPDADSKGAEGSQPSAAPNVTANGQVYWSVSDLLFSPKIRSAAEAIKRANAKTETDKE
jgi:hypothetical protein